MMKRTIKPAAGTGHITPEAALAAVRAVYRLEEKFLTDDFPPGTMRISDKPRSTDPKR
jgi:hypothetical protein